MWALFGRRARMYLLFAVAAPVAGAILKRVGEELEARGDTTLVSRGVHTAADLLHEQGRGPLARKLREQAPSQPRDRTTGG